jgi:hypothetical protein
MRENGAQPELVSDADRVLVAVNGVRWTVRELRERVSVVEPRIMLMREIDSGTRETLETLGGAAEDLARGLSAWGLVIDLADTGSATTTPDYRNYIPQYFSGLHGRSSGRLKLISIAFVGNPVARIVAKFVMARVAKVPVSIEKSRTHAIEAVRKALQGHA